MESNAKYNLNNEIVSVISAAVAMLGAKPGHKLVITSMRRTQQNSPVWNSTGRVERLRRNLNA